MEKKTIQNFLPDFCHLRVLYAAVLSSVVLALVLALAKTENLRHFQENFSVIGLYILWIVLTSIGVLCWLRQWLQRLSAFWSGFLAWVILLMVALLVEEVTWWSFPIFLTEGTDHLTLLYRTLGISAIIGALILRYLYENHCQKAQALAESRSRLMALQARIRPHFLFNSLNTVISVLRSSPHIAEEILYGLSDLFRASLADEHQLRSLDDELALIRQYLYIEQQRLGARLSVEWDVAGLPMQQPIPALLLQPLVENAVYHGIEPSVRGGRIGIYGRCRGQRLIFAVSNSLPETSEAKKRKGHHMALENIRQRLQLHYGEAAGMTTSLVDGCYQVRIWLPVEKCDEHSDCG